MNAEYINLFISAVTGVFEEMSQAQLSIATKTVRTGTLYEKNVVVLIGVTGEVRGAVTVSMDVEYAKMTASRMMCGMPVDQFDDMAQSAIREMVNMTMGRVASLFEKIGVVIDITPPTLMTGEGLSVSNEISPTLLLGFDDQNQKDAVQLEIAIRDAK